jgi:hypothetical protein
MGETAREWERKGKEMGERVGETERGERGLRKKEIPRD